MKFFIVAGEHSGDSHGADLIDSLRQRQPDIEFVGLGGPLMKQRAPEVEDWVDDASVVGFIEVLKHYGFFRQKFHQCIVQLENTVVDGVIMIDYPGFNLRLAKKLHERGLGNKLIYYISPQVWAWNRGRIPKMAKWLDLMLCLFPFEKKLYEEVGLRAEVVGHPLVEDLNEASVPLARDERLVGLFPGSREREIQRLFPLMLTVARKLKRKHGDLKFEVPAASERYLATLNQLREKAGFSPDDCRIVVGGSRSLMQRAKCGLIASGTATLEAAYFGLPYALVYKVAWSTYLLGRILVKIKYLGMINILADRELVNEFIQADAEPRGIANHLEHLLDDQQHWSDLSDQLVETAQQLGAPGASQRAAAAILALGSGSNKI